MFGTYQRLRVSVHASDVDVIRAIRRKIKKSLRRDPAFRAQRKGLYKAILCEHDKARRVFRRATGTIL